MKQQSIRRHEPTDWLFLPTQLPVDVFALPSPVVALRHSHRTRIRSSAAEITHHSVRTNNNGNGTHRELDKTTRRQTPKPMDCEKDGSGSSGTMAAVAQWQPQAHAKWK